MVTFPDVGEMVEEIIFRIVDFPAPLRPTKPILSFVFTTRLISSNKTRSPYFTNIFEAVIISQFSLSVQIYNLRTAIKTAKNKSGNKQNLIYDIKLKFVL